MTEKNNVVLIGMPGAGKSTAGVVLAKVLGYRFLDSDLLIQETEGRLLREIIEQEGLDGFIEVENRINAGIQVKNTVIATGGSVIYGEDAMKHLKEIGTIIYIQLSYEEISHRLGNVKQRGVVLKDNQTLEDLYQERCPLYEKYADIIVNAEETTIESLALLMKDNLQK